MMKYTEIGPVVSDKKIPINIGKVSPATWVKFSDTY